MSQPKAHRIEIGVKDLREALRILRKVVPNNPIVPSLHDVVIKIIDDTIVSITGSDLNNFVTVELSANSQIPLSSAMFVCPFNELIKLISTLRDQSIEIEFSDNVDAHICIYSLEGTFRFKSNGSLGDQPKLPTSKTISSFTMSVVHLKEGLTITSRSTSSDDLRPAMTGVYFDSGRDGLLNMVSTDGHTLTKYESYTKYEGEGFIVPGIIFKIMEAINCNQNTTAYISCLQRGVSIIINNVTIFVRYIDERYPDYAQSIPTDPKFSIQLDLKELKYRISLALLFSNRTTSQVVLGFQKGSLSIVTEDLDYSVDSEQTIPVDYRSESIFYIGINGRFFNRILKPYNDLTRVDFKKINSAILFHPQPKHGKSITLLLMPVMLNRYENY